MKRTALAAGAATSVLVLVALTVGYRTLVRKYGYSAKSVVVLSPAIAPPGSSPPASAPSEGFLYGRVATRSGVAYEGRLRFGGLQEAFWGDFFNGSKQENPWAAHVPSERVPTRRRPLSIFGVEIAQRERPLDLGRFFMARMGDLARVEAAGGDVRVTTKSGSLFVLDRFEASDFDDGLRVWDAERGVVDLDSLEVLAIDFLPAPPLADVPNRLHGTARSSQGDFAGFVQWNRRQCLGSDELGGRTAEGEVRLPFDSIRSIAREGRDGSRVTLVDGREVVLSRSRDVGEGNRGLYVDDARYGRVLVSWESFERVDFDAPGTAGSGPAYGDFPPGTPLAGSVTTKDGRRRGGRLVYDLDESETTETLDAPSGGVDYTLPFGLVASIVPDDGAGRARVILRDGEALELEAKGDLGERNAGLLVFVEGGERPEYVRWNEVARIDLDAPAAPVRSEEAPARLPATH
jgi:hypothetical protein